MTATPTLRLRPPTAPVWLVERPRLTRLILSVAPSEVLVITAAPGYGATTAVAHAAAISGDPVRWVSLEAQDSDEVCLQLLGAAVDSQASAGIDGVLAALIDAGPAWLVIDGVSLTSQPAFSRDLLDLAVHLPPHLRMVIISNQWFGPLPRALRLEEDDLSFTDDEAFDLLSRRVADIDVDAANAIIEASEGWPTALVAATSKTGVDGAAEWLRGAGAATLFGAWFASLTAAQQDLLARTRVLSQLCAGNATAVAQESRAPEILLELDAAHAFLREVEDPASGSGRWWRRHGLLGAYLDQIAIDDRVAAHSRAADWYLGTGDVDAIMHHLIAAGRSKEAGAFLAEHESSLLTMGGKADKVLSWYDQMDVNPEDRWIQMVRLGWGHALHRDIAAADATLRRIEGELAAHADVVANRSVHGQGADDDPQQPGTQHSAWVAQTALLRGYLGTFHADPAAAISGGRRLSSEPPAHLNADSQQLAPLLVVRGLIWSGQPAIAARVMEAASHRPFPNDVIRESHLQLARALTDVVNGFVRRAKVHADAAARWLHRSCLQHDVQIFGPSLAVTAQISAELGEVDQALILAHQALEDAERTGMLAEIVWAQLVIAECQLIIGDYGAALRTLVEARANATRDVPDSLMVVVVDQARAAVHLTAGDMVRAVRIIRALPPSDTRSLLWARAGLVKQPSIARRTLETIESSMPRIEAERQVLLAALHRRTSRRMAQGHLRKAAAIAYKNGLGQLLRTADSALLTLAESTALEYQDDNLLWLLKVRAMPRQNAVSVETRADVALSRGEMQLLSVLPTRAKNADIAEALGVSINTVKTRLRRLYAKLGVSSRDAAIEEAQARGLLQE